MNWKTTLSGLGAAVATALVTYAQNGGNLLDWKLWLPSALLAALGLFAHDTKPTEK